MNRMDGGQWTPRSRLSYNLRDAVTRSTVQVTPLHEKDGCGCVRPSPWDVGLTRPDNW